jgi:cell division protein FtsI (penicillin-binding protein 3)
VGLTVGKDNMYEYMRRFGFGSTTGVPLPMESRGLVRKPERWGKTSLASMAMGHEVSVTAMQLAQACTVIASGGMLIRPKLIVSRKRIGEATEIEPDAKQTRILKPETAFTMRRMMEGVVLNGTGKRYARIKGYSSGGKTGTAQIYDLASHSYTHHYNASFMGFAPVTNPAIVIAVTLNGTSGGDAAYGGPVAAPVFREVATAALRILDVPKDLPEDLPTPKDEPIDSHDLSIAGLDPTVGPELVASAIPSLVQGPPAPDQPLFVKDSGGPRVPNFSGKTMRDVLEEAAASGTPVELQGRGIARLQYPAPGQVLPTGEKVRIQFAR